MNDDNNNGENSGNNNINNENDFSNIKNNSFNNNFSNNIQFNQPVPQINNIFLINGNPNQNLLEGFEQNNNRNNLLDFNIENPEDKKSQDLLSNIQNAYSLKENNDKNDFVQQSFIGMNKDMNSNINNMNTMNNILFNLNNNINSMNNFNNNIFSNNQNINKWLSNNVNNAKNNYNIQTNNNYPFNQTNNTNNNRLNNNFISSKVNTSYQNNSNNINNNNPNPISFNMDYINKNLSIKTTKEKKIDPFASLLSFK